MTLLRNSLRRLLVPECWVTALLIGGALVAVVRGLGDGPRWLLPVGLTVSACALGLLGRVAAPNTMVTGAPTGRRALAPALVVSSCVVNKHTGRPALDRRDASSVAEMELVVVGDEGVPYRVTVQHPLDVRGLLHGDAVVVAYSTKRPWLVELADDPPRALRERAEGLVAEGAVHRSLPVSRYPGAGLPDGVLLPLAGLVVAAVLLVLLGV
ncbi:hypothetical protein [Streptomyces hyderabadensis]|uniref:Integral membrane protein n=1 Tax=Streptomyces hyderabadensis TaxID=598549 RepID=A0ABP9HW08_9ACTN|nr:hypothetical protein [Streptomyces hyderabadensis]